MSLQIRKISFIITLAFETKLKVWHRQILCNKISSFISHTAFILSRKKYINVTNVLQVAFFLQYRKYSGPRPLISSRLPFSTQIFMRPLHCCINRTVCLHKEYLNVLLSPFQFRVYQNVIIGFADVLQCYQLQLVKTKYSQAESLGSTIKSSGFTVTIRKISRLVFVFISLRWRKIANIYIQVHTIHKGDKQGPTNKWNKFLSDSLPTPLVESMSLWSNYESKKGSSETSVSRIFGGVVLVKITHLRNFCVIWSVWNQ